MSTQDELRDHYDGTDMSEAIGQAVREDPVDDLLVSTSIRLTKTIMDRIQVHAERAGVPATTLMRQGDHRPPGRTAGQAVVTVSDLEQFIAARARARRCQLNPLRIRKLVAQRL